MTTEIKVPTLGESVSEAGIAKVYKKVGDFIKTDEILVELETDKVSLEVNAVKSGIITEIKVKEGDNVKMGDIIAVIEEGDAQTTKITTTEPVMDKSVIGSELVKTANSHLSPAPQRIIPVKKPNQIQSLTKNAAGEIEFTQNSGEKFTVPADDKEIQAFAIWTILNQEARA